MERGLGYPALSSGNLTFPMAEDHDLWSDPTGLLHFKLGELIATIVDPDLDAQLAAERGRLEPLWSEYEAMLRVEEENPEAVSNLALAIQEGEALQLEASVWEREVERALMQAVLAPADAEIIEGTRHSVNINPLSGDLFRYYPLSHLRFQVRIPLVAWGPDWAVDLTVNGHSARILRIYSADFDETNEEWILGMEFKPSQSFERMSEEFNYELTTTSPLVGRLSRGLALHSASCAPVGQRRTYLLTAPKVSGLLSFFKEENSWVAKDEPVGGVTLSGMTELLEKVSRYRSRMDEFLTEVETEFIPTGIMAENDRRLILLRQYHAEAGRFVERASAMTVEAKESGLLLGTLDYQGPLTASNANLSARVKSPYVEILDVLIDKDIDVQDEDVVFVTLPSGSEKLAKVFEVVAETVGPIQDLRGNKLISVLAYDAQFHLGEKAVGHSPDPTAATPDTGMPVCVSIPVYADVTERTSIQSQLKADFERAKTAPAPHCPLYPIRFTFSNSSLSPLEKLAYMRLANPAPADSPEAEPGYLDLLTEAIIEDGNPQTRWLAFRKLIGARFTTGFDPFIQIALRGTPDVASASLFHLSEKRRVFELFELLSEFQRMRAARDAPEKQDTEPLVCLAYQLLRGLIDYPAPQSDALTHLVTRGRMDPVFQRRVEDFFFSVIQVEGVNSPASIRILRGKNQAGQPFFPEHALEAAAVRAEARGNLHLSRVFQRELTRRELIGISTNSKYGYGASFIETGFLFLRDLDKIDALARSRENYLHDLRFLESSPYWTEAFPLDPEVLAVLQEKRGLPQPVTQPESDVAPSAGFSSYGRDIEFPAFRQLAKPDRSMLIKDLGMKRDYTTLILLLRDPYIRSNNVGDILDWVLLSPEARLELARYYPQTSDTGLLDLIDQRQFVVEVLSDVDSTIRELERTSVAAARVPNAPTGEPVNPATIHIYQQLLLRLYSRTLNDETRFGHLVAWAGLLPSGFELGDATASLYLPLEKQGIANGEFRSAIRYVRERRALKHAVEREREKRAENRGVEIRPGLEETLLRQVVQDVEAGMPPISHPLALFEERLEAASAGPVADSYSLALQDTLRLVKIREQEFATGWRERLRFDDITAYAARIVLAPLFLLAIVPVIWLANLARLLLESLRLRCSYSAGYVRKNLRRSRKLLKSIEDSNPVKKEISRWIRFLEADSLNVDRLVRLQEKVKRIMNFRGLVYHVSATGTHNGPRRGSKQPAQPRQSSRPDSLHPEVSMKLAPCLTLLALLSRLTGERIWQEIGREDGDKRRTYLIMEWFLQRSAYFSGYRYTLNPLANHQIAETYVWQNIPLAETRGQPVILWFLLFPLNCLITIVNAFGLIFLSLPMRFVYLFTPISLLGTAVFKSSLRRLVIDAGNALEENLYPEPDALFQRTRERLRAGWARRSALPDQPGGRFVFTFRRVATRVLPFVIVTTIVSGGFPYLYELLTGGGWASAWNLRSTGVYASFAALVVLTVTMVLHWFPLLMGWIPFAHLRNLNRARLLRSQARRVLAKETGQRIRGRVDADDELQRLNLGDALDALQTERRSDSPILDILVLMVENPRLLDRYRRFARQLVSRQTVVLAYPTGESMDGGGARLSTLKTVHETYENIRKRWPHLPERFDQTRSVFMPIGNDCDPLIDLPVAIADPADPTRAESVPLTPFVLTVANVQALMLNSFVYDDQDSTHRFVGSVTAAPQRLYVGPHNVDQGGKFRGGITLLGAFESIQSAGRQGALVIAGNRAFIRNSPEQLQTIFRRDPDLNQWLDPLNSQKRQLPVAQLVIERFRTSERYGRHISTCVRYINEIQLIREELLAKGPLGETDVGDEGFLDDIAIHYMRHLIVPWFIAFHGGSLENYRAGVLTGDLGVRDRRRIFHQRVLDLVELIHEEGRAARRQLPKVHFANAPSARIYYAKTSRDAEALWTDSRLLFPGTPARPATAGERMGLRSKPAEITQNLELDFPT